jgi:hypothetical protein
LLSRVPFLFHGFGLDSDSWGVALAARTIRDNGIYEASRFPGYPVHELLCAATSGNYFFTNFISAFIGSIGILFFALTLKTLRFKYVFLASAALAAVPVIYINSTITIDYVVALGFILIGLYYVVKGNPLLAGVFLGVAIGSRITSGAMLLPFAIMLAQNDSFRLNIIRISKLVGSTLVAGVIFFVPVYTQYGSSFFSYYEVQYPDLNRIVYKMTIDLWGPIGFFAVILATALLFLSNKLTFRRFLFPRSVNEKYVVAWLIAIDLYIIAYLKLPLEAGYLIPIVPFVILIFGKYLYDKAFILFASLLIVSPFLISFSPLNRPDLPAISKLSQEIKIGNEELVIDYLKGPVFAYESRRKRSCENIDSLMSGLKRIDNLSLLICGKWYNQIQFEKNKKLDNVNVSYIDYMNEESLLRYLENGYDIYYLPREAEFNKQKYGYDLNEYEGVLMPFN